MDREITLALISAKSYRDFIKSYYSICKTANADFSYGTMAKRAHFSSKSFIRDIASGAKRITSRSLPGVIQALGLTGNRAKLFKLLVILEEADLNFERLSTEDIKTQIIKARLSIKKHLVTVPDTQAQQFYKLPLFPWIYAALGDPEQGASIQEIVSRSGIAMGECRRILKEMEQGGVIRFEEAEERYYCQDLHLIFAHIGKDRFFQKFYLSSLAMSKNQAEDNFTSPHKLFMNSVVSIRRSRMPELKNKLRGLLTEFVDEVEDAEGDTVANLSVAFFDLK